MVQSNLAGVSNGHIQDPIMHCSIKTTDSGGLFRTSVLEGRRFRGSPEFGNAGGRWPELKLPARVLCVVNWVSLK